MDECIKILQNLHKYQNNTSFRFGIPVDYKETFRDAILKLKDKNQTNEFNQTLLHLASLWNNYDAVDILLKYRLDPHRLDSFGNSSVDYAIKNQNRKMVERMFLDRKQEYDRLLKANIQLMNENSNERRKRSYTESQCAIYREEIKNLKKLNQTEYYKKKFEAEENITKTLTKKCTNLTSEIHFLSDENLKLKKKCTDLEDKLQKTEEERDVLRKRWEDNGRDKYKKK